MRHLVYMPIYHKPGFTFTMQEITEEDIFSIEKLRSLGLAYTLVQHPPFMEPAVMYAGPTAVETGVRVLAGCYAMRGDSRRYLENKMADDWHGHSSQRLIK